MSELTKVYVFDTTLRDGSQMEGITFSAEDKKEIISIARGFEEIAHGGSAMEAFALCDEKEGYYERLYKSYR